MGTTYEALYRERDLMDQAIATGSIKVKCRDAGALRSLRQRCYLARKLDRDRGMEIYEPHDKRHGESRYDGIVFIIKEDKVTLHLMNQENDLPLGVESIKVEE